MNSLLKRYGATWNAVAFTGGIGLLFPAGALLFIDRPVALFAIVCTAPFVLGTQAYLLGRYARRSEEIEKHARTIEKISRRLAAAQRISRTGSFEFCPATQELEWSEELYSIFGVDPRIRGEALFEIYRDRIHPEDRAATLETIERGIRAVEPYIVNHRILLEDGSVRHIRGYGEVTPPGVAGPHLLIRGTAQDVSNEVRSDRELRSLLETMTEGLIVHDHDGRVVHHNPAALQILCSSPDDQALNDANDPRWRMIREDGTELPRSEHAPAIARRTGQPVRGMLMGYRRSDGDLRWLRVNAAPLGDGENLRVVSLFSDVTELVEARRENRFVLNALGIGVWKYDPNDRSLSWDESMYRLFEVDPQDFTGEYQAWERSLTPESRNEAVSALDAALRGEREFNHTFEIRTPSGETKHIGGRATVTRDESGRALKVYGVNWDRSAEVRLERQIQSERTKSIQHAKLASLGEMSAGIAHEVNNPLAVIAGTLPMLRRFREQEDKFEQKLAALIRSTDRIARIVSGLKKFSRTSEGQPLERVGVADLIRDALVIAEVRANRAGVVVTFGSATPAKILCSPIEIEQVIVNLVHNAVDAAKGRDEAWARVEAFDDGAEVVVRVLDSGPGLSPEIEARLFEPFFTTKPVGEGTGLGLPIVRGILEQHRATLVLNRSLPQTCFEVRFSRAPEV